MRKGQFKGQQPDPIARWEPAAAGEILLMDTRAMMLHLAIGDRTVRRYPPIVCDLATRAPLWDALAVGKAREQVRARQRATRTPLRMQQRAS
jgi:hypothetical protein